MGLSLLGGIILAVLTQIALLTSLSNGCRSLRTFHRFQAVQFGYELVIALL